jgi:hypothetical protein
MKRADFMDRNSNSGLLSTKTALFMDSEDNRQRYLDVESQNRHPA